MNVLRQIRSALVCAAVVIVAAGAIISTSSNPAFAQSFPPSVPPTTPPATPPATPPPAAPTVPATPAVTATVAPVGTQSMFCPVVPGAPPGQLVNGFCTYNLQRPTTQADCPNGFGPVSFGSTSGCAGVSSAALASQNAVNIASAISAQNTELINDRIRQRRLTDRRLEQFAALAGITYAADLPGKAATPAPPAAVARPALWAQAFGDYEHRDLFQSVSLAQRTQIVDNSTTTRTGGIIGGVDVLFSNIMLGNDAILVGLTGGYADATVKTKGSVTDQTITTTTVGLYGAYVLSGFSLGLTAKTDFVNLNQTFVDFAFSNPFPPVFGGFSVTGQNYSVGGSLSYRFDFGSSGWFAEPTVGLDFTRSTFDNGAQFGLTDGSTLRGRAGSTFGTTIVVDQNFALQPTFGAFIFSNLEVNQGGASLNVDFNNLQTVQTDEGKVRGQLQATLNLITASGLTAFAQAEYRFGEDLQGGAGKVGVRYQF